MRRKPVKVIPPASEELTKLHEFVTWVVRRSALENNLSFRQLAVLTTLRMGVVQPSGVKELAAYLCVSKPAITRAVDRLSGLLLVERAVNVEDRRTVDVTLTSKGTKALDQMGRETAKPVPSHSGRAELPHD